MADSKYCVLTLALHTEPWQEHILEKRFAIMEHLKNQLIAMELRKLKNLRRRKDYRLLEQQIPDAPPEQRKRLNAARKKILKEYGFSEFDFKNDMAGKESLMQKHFAEHIAAQVAHRAASEVWQAFEKYLFSNGKAVHFHKKGSLESVGCQTAGNGMKYENGLLIWSGGRSPQQIVLRLRAAKPKTDYERRMLEKEVKNMRVLRRWVKTGWRYYLQLTLVGEAIRKNRPLGTGRVGIDIGPQSVAIAAQNKVQLLQLASGINRNHAKEQQLKRQMDRSRRYTNPQNYRADGTIVRPPKGKLKWTYSARYRRLAGQVRELERKNAAIRRQQHMCLANQVLALGNEVYIEKMNFAAMQHRAKETRRDKNGRCLSKKRFGKSLARRAPATFVTILKNKAAQAGAAFHEVKTASFKASQYDHTSGEYCKAPLSQRIKRLSNGDLIQRDIYSAFLLMNSSPDLTCTDRALCRSTYPHFKELYELEVKRIQNDPAPHPASFGIA